MQAFEVNKSRKCFNFQPQNKSTLALAVASLVGEHCLYQKQYVKSEAERREPEIKVKGVVDNEIEKKTNKQMELF